MKRLETEQLKVLLTNVHKQGNEGATFYEVMDMLKAELSKTVLVKPSGE